jgi:hypothetical protein
MSEAKQLRESTLLPKLVEELRVIILSRDKVDSTEANIRGRRAFHLMLALALIMVSATPITHVPGGSI